MLLEDQLPRIQKLIKEKLGPLPVNALQNEAVMQAAFRRLYQALPRMIRLAVSEQGFVEFCMANRERLLNLGDAVSEKFSTAKTADTTGSEAQSVQKAELAQNENRTTAEMLATSRIKLIRPSGIEHRTNWTLLFPFQKFLPALRWTTFVLLGYSGALINKDPRCLQLTSYCWWQRY